MADTYHAIKLYKTTSGNTSSGKRVGINVTNSTDTSGYVLYVNGSIGATSAAGFVDTIAGTAWGAAVQWRTRASTPTAEASKTKYQTYDQNKMLGAIYFQVPSKRIVYDADAKVSSESYYKSRFFFRQYSTNATGIRGDYREDYYLPECDLNLTKDINYFILTTKNSVAISQGGTGATTALGANDNLGSIYWAGAGTALTSGTNIDTGLTLGHTYYSEESSVTKTLKGTLPTTKSGFKIVQFRTYYSNYDKQFAWGTAVTPYLRTRANSTSVWGDWHTVAYIKANATTGSTTTPVYVASTGEIKPITSAIPISLGGTGATTVANANNNLQTWSLGAGTAIPENANLNNYKTIGNYHCNSTATAKTVDYAPYHGTVGEILNSAFTLKVYYGTGTTTTYLKQELKRYNNSEIWQRYSTNSGSTWSDWSVLVKRNGTTAISNENTPVYVDEYGTVKAITGAIPVSLGGTGGKTAAAGLKNLVGSTAIGNSVRPIYWSGSAFTEVSNIEISTSSTTDQYIRATNSHGSIDLLTSTNRGVYDRTKKGWLIYTTETSTHTYIPLWASKGNVYTPVYFNSAGEPVACSSMTALYNGGNLKTTAATLTNGWSNYNYLVILGHPGNITTTKAVIIVPTALITSTQTKYSMMNENGWLVVGLTRNGNNISIVRTDTSNTNACVTHVYGGI